ncbi:MAG: T9SS type A sorting domain-containing protein [Bacteroidota bacterium]
MKTKNIFLAALCLLISNSLISAPVHIIVATNHTMTMTGNVVVSVTGNLINTGTIAATGTSTIKFCGTSLQQIGGAGTTQLQNVELNNPANFTLLGDATITGAVTFTSGILSTNTNAITLIMSENSSFSPASGTATNFINGRIRKTGNGSAFTFPVGDIRGATVVWAPLQMASYTNTNNFAVSYTYRSAYDSLGYVTWPDGASFGPGLHHVSGKEFWLIDRTGAGAQTPGVTLYWKDAVRSGFVNNGSACTELSDLTFAHWNSSISKWEDMGGTAYEISFSSGGYITSLTTFSDYSPVTFGSKGEQNPLPIELLSFTADCEKTNMKLKWQTASEINNDYFVIEKSTDAKTWMPIDTIGGMGNSNTLINYSYTDNDMIYNIYYYRLKQMDYNGVFTYSSIVQSGCIEDIIEIINIYPNPAQEHFDFVVCAAEEKEIYIIIVDVLGQLVFKSTETITKGLSEISIPVFKLSPATYCLSVETTDGICRKSKQILVR